MHNEWKHRLRAALDALTEKSPEDPRNRVAALELDLRQKNVEADALRKEYQRLQQHAQRERETAASAGFDILARRIAPVLSQLATMATMVGGKQPPRLEDVTRLSDRLEQMLAEQGLMRIGKVGEEAVFDTRYHQCMDEHCIVDGDNIRVRFVGYRLDQSILLKAIVSRAMDHHLGAAP